MRFIGVKCLPALLPMGSASPAGKESFLEPRGCMGEVSVRAGKATATATSPQGGSAWSAASELREQRGGTPLHPT